MSRAHGEMIDEMSDGELRSSWERFSSACAARAVFRKMRAWVDRRDADSAPSRADEVEYDGPVHVRVMKSGRFLFHVPEDRGHD